MNKFIAVSPLVEIHIDLYGFSVGWVETIQNKISSLYRSSLNGHNDKCETFSCWAAGGVGVRFLTDTEYAKTVTREAFRLLNLARKTYRKLA